MAHMLLLLPVEEQQSFADPEWINFCGNIDFNSHQLFKAENYQDKDPRLSPDDKGWTTQHLGNLAHMVLHAPEQFRARWAAVHKAFIERAAYIDKM